MSTDVLPTKYAMEDNLQQTPEAMTTRACTVEHPFGTIKLWTGSRHFLMKQLKNVRTEMSLNVLAYNLRRMISIFGVSELIKVVKAAAVYCFSVVVRLFKRLESKKYSWQYQHPVKINLGRRALNAI